VSKGRIQPQIVCTDREPALAVREFVGMPVVLVLGLEDGPPDAGDGPLANPARVGQAPANTWRLDAAHGPPGSLIGFRLGRNRLAVPGSVADDPRQITDRLGGLPDGFDLAEPFQRIREAIEEARRGGH
jgi:hypothetical protein